MIDPEPIGAIERVKNGERCVTTLYAMAVLRALDVWPERSWRRRRWVEAGEAARLVQADDLARCIRDLAERLDRDRARTA
ncbi:MAG: NUDIX hydrolase [Planctomycetota bacterium]